jgi:nucleoside-diphosphate-sugar epimerase
LLASGSKMKVAINGCSGFVGRHLIERLARDGFSGIGIARRLISDMPEGWEFGLREPVLAQREFACDTLVHLEVKHHVAAPQIHERRDLYKFNVMSTGRWLDWCGVNSVRRFVLFSSTKVLPGVDAIQDELSPLEPNSEYGKSKLAAEELVCSWVADSPGRSALILRPTVIYGPGNVANVFSMVHSINRGTFRLVGRNENIKSLVSVGNVVASVSHLISRSSVGVEVYNIVDRDSFSVRQIAEMVSFELGRQGRIRSIPLALASFVAGSSELCCRLTGRSLPLTRSRLNAMLETTHFSPGKLMATGFVHPQTTREGLREMVAWYQMTEGKRFPGLG